MSVFVPIYYMVKWSQQWNEDIANEREYEERDTNEEADDTETRYKLD